MTNTEAPASTYRVQLRREFTFGDLETLVPYLASLGITHVYCSPYLAARPGSPHGYDICDHSRLNPEIGDEAALASLVSTLRAHGMGHVLDFVPNHMGIDATANHWWRDVLENGPESPWARFFDIDWNPVKPEMRGKLLLPILGDRYGEVLERGELRLERYAGGLRLRYFEHDLPLDPRTLPEALGPAADSLAGEPEESTLREALTQLASAPAGQDSRRARRGALDRLQGLISELPRLAREIDRRIEALNGRPGESGSFEALHQLLERQAYRLAWWKTAFHEINYRRFFDINDLAGVRVEDPEVFEATHVLVVRLVKQGLLDGIRLDHVDGLFDPCRYLERLRAEVGDVWIVVEKILSEGESLPPDWSVAGTTGYDFLNDLNGLFVDHRAAGRMRRLYTRFTGRTAPFPIVTYVGKRLITQTSMASELNVLTYALNRISEQDRRSRDFTLESLREALREVVACFPVYRSYVSEGGRSPEDDRVVDVAIAEARRRNPAVEPSIFGFVRSVLLPETGSPGDGRLQAAMRFQQYSGPVQAKGVEDTAFYRHNVLLSLNEVGGEPDRFGRSVEEFHEANARRQAHWPTTMLSTATHDTKRGEDARARINVLSEMPEQWQAAVSRWARLNAGRRVRVEGEWAPDRNEEYLYYQSLLGAWPAGGRVEEAAGLVGRLQAYLVKALREAKLHTSWTNVNEPWERAVTGFVERTLTGPRARRFLDAFLPFQRRVAAFGAANSLSQLVLKIAAPGVPDFYQGNEWWDLSLVDPDNRRPVDFERRRRVLDDLLPLLAPGSPAAERRAALEALAVSWPDGRIKHFITACGLRCRREERDLFLGGDYLALACDPPEAGIVAFARRHRERVLLALATRLRAGVAVEERPLAGIAAGSWRVMLPSDLRGRTFTNVLTGETVEGDDTGGIAVARALGPVPATWLLA